MTGKDDFEAQLALFNQDPKRAMNQRLPKRDRSGQVVPVQSAFSQESIQSGQFVKDRDRYRQKMCTERAGQRICLDQVLPGKAPFLDNDRAENLVDNSSQMLRTLPQMESAGLLSAALRETPWSSSYWPIYRGELACRYADGSVPSSQDWQQNQKYALGLPASAVVASGDQAAIDNLSPAEKYDLLVGDDAGTLTRAMWQAGQGFYESTGKVETWMGICHGWSPASYLVSRPRTVVSLTAADGRTRLNFYPADMKALAALLYTQAGTPTRFIGGRCNDKAPAMDENGRVTSQDCFDTNPGTWHLGVVNQIGVSRRSFVIDATFDYEVWNQPVYGYTYSYFNPTTGQRTSSLADARVARTSYTNDKFQKYRSANAAAMVGIAMSLTYVVEVAPTHATVDGPNLDGVRTVSYLYDVELDASGQIIGGEWYTNLHPDFMWTMPPKTVPVSVGDGAATEAWSGGPVPASFRDAALASSAQGQPLSRIVMALIGMAE